MSAFLNKKFALLVAGLLAAAAAVLSGDTSTQSIGELVFAVIAVATYVEARLTRHDAAPDAHEPPPASGV